MNVLFEIAIKLSYFCNDIQYSHIFPVSIIHVKQVNLLYEKIEILIKVCKPIMDCNEQR